MPEVDVTEPDISGIRRLTSDVRTRLNALSAADIYNADGTSALDCHTLYAIRAELVHSLSRVQRLCNVQAPVNILPPETLLAIFENVAKTHSPVPLTHVCQYWRELALRDPSLWTPIEFSPVTIFDDSSLPYELLRRSAGVPCQVSIDCNGVSDGKVWRTLATRCHEIARLDIDGLEDLRDIQHLSNHAPLLESLSIHAALVALDSRDDGQLVLNEDLPLLFSGYTPSLRNLTVHYFTEFANRFADLTTLNISHQSYGSPSGLSHLFSILQASPGLEILTLEECGFKSPNSSHITAVTSDGPYISLPRLHKLIITDCHPEITRSILSCIELPRTDGVLVRCYNWRTDVVRPADALFPIDSRLRIRSLQNATKLQINYDGVIIHAISETSSTLFHAYNDLHILDFIIPSARLMLHFNMLQELWLSGIDLHSVPFWQGVFSEMTALRKLVLNIPPTSPDSWLRALGGWGLNGRPYPAPALETLWVFPPLMDAAAGFLSMVKKRDEDGHRIQHLRVLLHSATQNENFRRSFSLWKNNAPSLEGSAGDVSFDTVEEYPCLDDPQAGVLH